MTELIKVSYDSERPTVSGRDLHDKLGIKTQYKDWFPRMCEYGFSEGADYCSFLSESTGGRPATNHQLTIDMAKQICMIQRTEEGRRYREYFLDVERRWNSPEAIMGRALKIAEAKLEEAKQTVAQLAPKAAYYDTVADSSGLTSFRETAKLFGIKEHDFIRYIEQRKLCYRDSRNRLIPYAEDRKAKWFEVKEIMFSGADGPRTTIYAKITPVGRTKIFELMRRDGVL